MKRYTCIALVLLLILSMTACSREPENLMEEVKPNISESTAATGYESEILDFYMELFRKTHAQDKNTLISPLSVLQALSMTANGARGETLRQMEDVFGLDIDALNNASLNWGDNSDFLHLANSVWLRDSADFTVNPDFLQQNADYYGADVFKAPFDAETCRKINAWVEKNTDGQNCFLLLRKK